MAKTTHRIQDSRHPNQTTYYQDDEISLADLLKILREQWKIISATAVAAPVIAFGVTLGIPSLYEAEVLLQIGVIPSASDSRSPSSRAGIEEPEQLARRLSSAGFVGRLQGQVDPGFSLKATALKNTKLLRLEGRARSPEKAREGVEATIMIVQKDHSEALSDARKTLESLVINVRARLSNTHYSIERLTKETIGTPTAQQDVISALLLTQTQNQLNQQRLDLMERLSVLEASLSSQNTFATQVLEPIQVDKSPAYPKTKLVVLVAFLAGGFAGVLLAFLRNTLKGTS